MPRPILLLPLALAACTTAPRDDSRPVRVATAPAPLKHGDCIEARRLAAERPNLEVDRIPAPLAMKPPALAKVPPGVVGAKGAVIKADVIIDTLGRADMTTFKIIEASHPWLASHIKATLPKWKYSPAELAGCKVARVYHFSATAPPAKSRKAR